MLLSDNVKQQIIDEYNNWFDSQYGDKSLEERKQLDAFFTPPEITIQMLEQYTAGIKNITILDPSCGTGNLLVACIIAGANPDNIYGIELDETFANICKQRLSKYNVPEDHIIVGDATQSCNYVKSSKDVKKYKPVDLW